jgi:hypothetical protein
MHDDWNTPLSDLVSLKYFYSEKYFPSPPAPRWKALSDNTVYNTLALPRAFVVGGYHIHHDGEKEDIVMIQEGDIDCSKELILYSQPAGIPPSKPEYLGEAKITHYGNNDVEMECSISKPGILFLSDPFFPGWNAWVDGQRTEIIKADRAFRAVVLSKPGSHKIRMDYQPLSIKAGVLISIVGWLSLAWLVLRKRDLKIHS